MKKGEIYNCYVEYTLQGIFEVVSKTDISYKLKQTEQCNGFNYLRGYTEKDGVRYISGKFDNKCNNCFKNLDNNSFVIYLNREGLPFIFNLITNEKLTY